MTEFLEIAWKDKSAKGFMDEIPLTGLREKKRCEHYYISVRSSEVFRTNPKIESHAGGKVTSLVYSSKSDGTIPGTLKLEFRSKKQQHVENVFWRDAGEVEWTKLQPDEFQVIESDEDSFAKTTRKVLSENRLYKSAFRRQVIKKWGGKCAVTGIDLDALLRSSHIVPHSVEKKARHRINPENGLSLIANLDALFDRGLISFSDEGKLEVHPDHPEIDKLKIEWRDRKLHPPTGSLSKNQIRYLRIHRKLYNFPN